MFEIIDKVYLTDFVVKMNIYAPKIAQKAEPGQFIVLRVDKNGERIPLTIADFDRKLGIICIIFQVVGSTTKKLEQLNKGDKIIDFVGPLGNATELNGLKRVVVVGGGVGCAIAFPIAKKLHNKNAIVHSVVGFRSKNLVILENEFAQISDKLFVNTDDGSYGEKGFVTKTLENLLISGEKYDEAIVIGPLIMMKNVCELTKKFNLKTVVSMNPIMIDGTGMCGGCRLTVDGKVKFACIDGPDFDGHKVDFDEAIARSNMYSEIERKSYENTCNLYKAADKLDKTNGEIL